jgi:hypothetical protein
MFVHVLADDAAKLSDLCGILHRRFRVAAERLDVDAKLSQAPLAVVVRADLSVVKNVAALKKRSSRMAKIPKRIFLVEEPSHVCISQAYALGATLALLGTINQSKLFAALADPADPKAASPTRTPQQDNALEIAATGANTLPASAARHDQVLLAFD